VPDDLGKALYDLRRLLRGEHRFESEISEEIRKTVPELRARGQFVPWQVFTRGEGSLSQRDMVAGSSFIQTERLPDIADALRPVSQVIASGATVLTDLTNNISWPRWQLPSTPSAVTEIGPISSSGQTSSLLALSAHRVSSMTTVSKQLLTQGSNMKLEELIKTECSDRSAA
jgi:HK97 family phage major capsid protein